MNLNLSPLTFGTLCSIGGFTAFITCGLHWASFAAIVGFIGGAVWMMNRNE